MLPAWLAASEEVAAAVRDRRPVVALESTLIAHGLPWPVNVETAREAESAVRIAGAVPATVAVWHGTPTAGFSAAQIEELARAEGVMKASRRDLGAAVAGQRLAATTVSATMAIAHAAGIRVFATGGIGGAHRGEPGGVESWDISSDLTELGRTPVLVVCAGAKSILDLPRTLEILETLGVPVFGYRTDVFPAFYVQSGPTVPLPVSSRVESASEAARTFEAHTRLGGAGAVLAQPCPGKVAIPAGEFHAAFEQAQAEASREGVSGAKVTPFLLKRIAELTSGRTLAANRALIVNNARLAAEVATELSHLGR
jgi:pseudouridine-5'-phosphate glycosidase